MFGVHANQRPPPTFYILGDMSSTKARVIRWKNFRKDKDLKTTLEDLVAKKEELQKHFQGDENIRREINQLKRAISKIKKKQNRIRAKRI